MGMGSWWHWLIVAVVVLLLFGGKGKLSNLMGDAAKGIRAFRDGLMKWASKLPDHVGEFFAMKAYFMFPRIDASYLRRLVTNFGRSDAERRRNAPYLLHFVQNLTD